MALQIGEHPTECAGKIGNSRQKFCLICEKNYAHFYA